MALQVDAMHLETVNLAVFNTCMYICAHVFMYVHECPCTCVVLFIHVIVADKGFEI